jgi:hypothetical protein
MKLLHDSHKILKNKFVLYFVLLLALADVIFLAMGREYASVAIFLLTGFVSSFFSKNMIVILCIAMTITNVLRIGTGGRLNEGFEEGEENKENDDQPTKDNFEEGEQNNEETPKKPIVDGGEVSSESLKKINETMDKIEAYEPAIKAMDSLIGKLYELTGQDEITNKK